MRGNRSRDTRPELAVRSAVHRLGLRFRVSARPLPGIRRSADLVFTGARVAVFVDGCYWHGCTKHKALPKTNTEFWAQKIAANAERDRLVDRALTDAGWLVLRFWEHDDLNEVCDAVERAVRVARPHRALRRVS